MKPTLISADDTLPKAGGFVLYVDPKTGMATCGGALADTFHFPHIPLDHGALTGGPAIVSIDTLNHVTEVAIKSEHVELGLAKDAGFVITVDPKTGIATCGGGTVADAFHFSKFTIEHIDPVGGPLIVPVSDLGSVKDSGFVITVDPGTGIATCGGTHGVTLVGAGDHHPSVIG